MYLRADDGTGESDAVPVVVDQTAPRARVTIEIDAIEALPGESRTFVDAPGTEPLRISEPRSINLGHVRSSEGRGTVLGLVVGKGSNAPVPYVDLRIEPGEIATFTSDLGSFRLLHAPAGMVRIRARRIGFTPVTVDVRVRDGETDTLRIELPPVALALSRIRVRDAVCPNQRAGIADSALVTILKQIELNAERGRLLARQFPFEMVLRRTIANEGYDPSMQTRRVIVDTLQVDTVTATLEHEWQYSPGAMIREGKATGNRKLGAPERLVIPQLVDFAEPAFLGAHCFRFAGVTTLDGQRYARVDFQPVKNVQDRDVSGELYLDTDTYQVLRSTLRLQRNSPQKAGDIWVIRVDTWFREIVPSLPVIDRVAQRTTLRTIARPDAWPGQAATEVQQLIDVRFLTRRPQ